MNEREEKKLCPFNNSHYVSKGKFMKHIRKCQKQYPHVELVQCKYDITHIMKPNELKDHLEFCDAKLLHGQSAKEAFEYLHHFKTNLSKNGGTDRDQQQIVEAIDWMDNQSDVIVEPTKIHPKVKVKEWLESDVNALKYEENTIEQNFVVYNGRNKTNKLGTEDDKSKLKVDEWLTRQQCSNALDDPIQDVYDDLEKRRIKILNNKPTVEEPVKQQSFEDFIHQYFEKMKKDNLEETKSASSNLTMNDKGKEDGASSIVSSSLVSNENSFEILKERSKVVTATRQELNEKESILSSSTADKSCVSRISSRDAIRMLKINQKTTTKVEDLSDKISDVKDNASSVSSCCAPSQTSQFAGANHIEQLMLRSQSSKYECESVNSACDSSVCSVQSIVFPNRRITRPLGAGLNPKHFDLSDAEMELSYLADTNSHLGENRLRRMKLQCAKDCCRLPSEDEMSSLSQSISLSLWDEESVCSTILPEDSASNVGRPLGNGEKKDEKFIDDSESDVGSFVSAKSQVLGTSTNNLKQYENNKPAKCSNTYKATDVTTSAPVNGKQTEQNGAAKPRACDNNISGDSDSQSSQDGSYVFACLPKKVRTTRMPLREALKILRQK